MAKNIKYTILKKRQYEKLDINHIVHGKLKSL